MRRCGYCKVSIEGMREGAKYCDDRCRAKAWKQAHRPDARQGMGVTAGTVADAPGAPSSNGSEPRRPTRDGKGTKLYLVPSELQELTLGPPYPLTLQRKLRAARERITP